jgi:hypothetical protein
MDQISTNSTNSPDQPKNQKHHKNCPQHFRLLLLPLSRICLTRTTSSNKPGCLTHFNFALPHSVRSVTAKLFDGPLRG